MYNNLFHIFYNNLCEKDSFLPKKYILNDMFLSNLSKYRQIRRDTKFSMVVYGMKSCFDMCTDDLHMYIYMCYCKYKDMYKNSSIREISSDEIFHDPDTIINTYLSFYYDIINCEYRNIYSNYDNLWKMFVCDRKIVMYNHRNKSLGDTDISYEDKIIETFSKMKDFSWLDLVLDFNFSKSFYSKYIDKFINVRKVYKYFDKRNKKSFICFYIMKFIDNIDDDLFYLFIQRLIKFKYIHKYIIYSSIIKRITLILQNKNIIMYDYLRLSILLYLIDNFSDSTGLRSFILIWFKQYLYKWDDIINLYKNLCNYYMKLKTNQILKKKYSLYKQNLVNIHLSLCSYWLNLFNKNISVIIEIFGKNIELYDKLMVFRLHNNKSIDIDSILIDNHIDKVYINMDLYTMILSQLNI